MHYNVGILNVKEASAMSEYTIPVVPLDCDYFNLLPPRRLLEHFIDITLREQHRDGCGLEELAAELDAVWMISHARMEQKAPVSAGDVLIYRTEPRMEKRSCYFFFADVERSGEIVAHFECSYIPVYRVSRRILRLSQLTALWNTPPQPTVPSPLHRLHPHCEFLPCGSDEVRFSDCDLNRHMTSGAYVSLLCDALGFWSSETPRIMQHMQLDYSSEVYPGTELRFIRGEADGKQYVRGIKPDGKIAFTAECVF